MEMEEHFKGSEAPNFEDDTETVARHNMPVGSECSFMECCGLTQLSEKS